MTFNEFSVINRRRSESSDGFNHNLSSWSRSDWFMATLGELGEAANVAKKLKRAEDGIKGNTKSVKDLKEQLGDEIADTFIYLDLLAQSQGMLLEDIVKHKFNTTSDELNLPYKL